MMEGLKVLDTENSNIVADNKSKGEKRANGSKMGSLPRKKLADVSNLQQQPKPSNKEAKLHQTFSPLTTHYIDNLRKENMTLIKVLAERNKIIELSGIELQKLRINLQKVQQHNSQLALAHTQMLAELNSGKDKLKALQHELGCKNGLIKARKFVLESKAKTVTCVTSEIQVGADKHDEAGKLIEAEEVENKSSNASRREQPSKNKSLDSSTVKPVQAKENIDNKRPCLRRQSARFKSEMAEPTEGRLCLRRQSAQFDSEEAEPTERRVCTRRQSARFKSGGPEPNEELLVKDEAKFHASHELVHESCPTYLSLSAKRERKREHEEGNGEVEDVTQGNRRYSGRPSRQATVKVQSYKEIPINVKMRREK